MNRFLRYLPCASTSFIMLIIFYFSGQNAQVSTNSSNSLILTLINLLPDFLIKHDVDFLILELSHIVRKSAHFLIYALLGANVFWMFTSILDKAHSRLLIIISVLFCFLYACTDEFHQLFVAGRSGEIRDILIDTSGAVVGIILIFLFFRMLRRKNK